MGRLLTRNFSGPSIKFDGSATKIVSTNVLDFTGSGTNHNLTFALWHYCVETVSPSRRFFGGATGQFYCGRNSSNIYFCGVNGVGTNSSAKVPVGKWSFFAVTVSGSEYRHYINGNLVAVNTQANTATIASAMEIGKDAAGNYANDYIAEPAIFNRALTAEEIRAIYEQGPVAYPKDGSCVLDYRFKEGAVGGIAGEIIDYSGKGNHGQLTMGSGRIDPYNIPVPNRVLIPGNMPLVAVESTGVNSISVPDATIAAAFGVAAGQVGVNGLSVGSWVKNKKYAVQPYFASKGSYNNYGSYLSMSSSKAFTITSNGSGTNYLLTVNQIAQVSWNNLAAINGIDHYKVAVNGLLNKKQYVGLVGHGAVSFSIIASASGNISTIALPFLANRVLTDEEVFRIYQSAIFPADVLFWHGADSTGTKIMCHKGSYGNRPAEVVACDATLGSGNYFTDDVPWR